MPPWEILTSGKVKIEIDPSMADREELWLDLGCGTATGATLYALLFYPKARVICYDRDNTSEYVKGFLPPSVRHRVKVITGDDGDVGKLTIEKLETEAEADATEKGFCDKELAETNAKKDEKTTKI